jgi:hypothetical protein
MFLCVGKIALFDKALVSALARGALAMCAMWVGNCFKKCAVGKKQKTSGRHECRLSCLVNISFFCPFTMVYFSILVLSSVFLHLAVTLSILSAVSLQI